MNADLNEAQIVGDMCVYGKISQVDNEHGVGVTILVRRANIPYTRISVILKTLVSQGLLEQTNSDGACRYKVSGIGKEFLLEYQKFSSFAEDYGMTV